MDPNNRLVPTSLGFGPILIDHVSRLISVYSGSKCTPEVQGIRLIPVDLKHQGYVYTNTGHKSSTPENFGSKLAYEPRQPTSPESGQADWLRVFPVKTGLYRLEEVTASNEQISKQDKRIMITQGNIILQKEQNKALVTDPKVMEIYQNNCLIKLSELQENRF